MCIVRGRAGASLVGLQDESLALILRVIAGARNGERWAAKHERSRKLLSWRSLLLTSRVSRLARPELRAA